jgi:hypothetical protein
MYSKELAMKTINYYDDNNNITCTEIFNNNLIVKRITGDFVEDYIRDENDKIIEYKSSDGYSNKLNKTSVDEVMAEFENNKTVFVGSKNFIQTIKDMMK